MHHNLLQCLQMHHWLSEHAMTMTVALYPLDDACYLSIQIQIGQCCIDVATRYPYHWQHNKKITA